MNSPLTERLAKWKAEHPDHVAAPARNPMQRWQDHNTRLTSIGAMCWMCMGGTDGDANGARASIRECTSGPQAEVPCPLWTWRPYKR